MSILRRIASALSTAPVRAEVTPPGVGRREAVTGGLPGTGSGALGAGAATVGVPCGHHGRVRPGGDRDHLATLWVDLGGSD